MNFYSSRPPRRDPYPAARTQQQSAPLFDPNLPLRDLVDALAEKQAQNLTKIGGSQLRRFFGEIKDLYRQFRALTASTPETDDRRQEIYAEKIEPRFKMLRSKVHYALRKQEQARISPDYADFFDHGIKVTHSAEDFDKFVRHLEAVVGFLYGLDKVQK